MADPHCAVRAGLVLAASLVALANAQNATALRDASAPAELRFALRSQPHATRSLASLRAVIPASTVRVHEPYEGTEARFVALPLEAVLDAVYADAWRSEEELLFTCSDGYQPTVPVQRVLAHRAWLAFDRVDAPGFTILKHESGERKTIELGPFYLVWENLDDPLVRQEADYGWPYQLVEIDLIRTRDRFPRMAPPHDAPPRVQSGFVAFRVHCSKCHRVNGEGGTIGPELNAAKRPVEYRDRDWLRTWIEDPASLLPTARMPRLNPALPDRARTIDDILAYLAVMSRAQPAAENGSEAGEGSEDVAH